MGFIDNIRNYKRNKITKGLVDPIDEATAKRMTVLQNEISVAFGNKVIAIASVNDDKLAAAFAFGFAKAYAGNGAKCLVLDANLFNPSFSEYAEGKVGEMAQINEAVSAYCMKQEVYPSEIYKAGEVHKLINENKDKFGHIIVLVPSLRDHKEVCLLKDVIDSVMLITQKSVTRKARIYEAAAYLCQEQMPLSKVVVLK